jgi:hypothetical protein
MEAYKAILTKRDSRSYTTEPISEEALRRLLQAGRMAGSSKNTQLVRFVVVRDKEHMAELAKCGDFSQPLGPATAAIAICIPEGAQEFDAGRAGQNVMLAAWNEGLASAQHSCRVPGREVLNLPEACRIVMVVRWPPGAERADARDGREPFEERALGDVVEGAKNGGSQRVQRFASPLGTPLNVRRTCAN